MKLEELLRQLIAQQEAIHKAAKDGKRDLTADEQKNFDDLQKQIDETKAKIKAAEGAAPAGTAPSAADEAQRAVAAERQRTAEITTLCRDFGVDPATYISEGKTIEETRAAVLEHLRKTSGPVGVSVTAFESDKFRAAVIDGLAMRAGVPIAKPADGAMDFRGMSLRDLAIECLSREGKSTQVLLRMNKDDLYSELQRAFFSPSASFPAIMDAAIDKAIVHSYQSVPTTFQAFTSKGSVSDFKPTADRRYLIGGAGDFLLVPENGELKHDLPGSSLLPQRQIRTYGRQFSMTRQAFINDDIGFLTEVPGLYAAKAKQTIDRQVYNILFNNPVIFDGAALFTAGAPHANLTAAAAAPSQQTVQNIILLAQRQTDPFGDAIYMTPKFLVMGVGYEFTMATLFGSAQLTGSPNNDINPLYNYPLTVIQSPILNGLAGANACPWFMVADPMSAKGIQVDYLNGNETPFVRRMEAPGQLGFTWDIFLDWGVSVVDFRGLYRNNGAVIPAV
jgi:hypothetical protein